MPSTHSQNTGALTQNSASQGSGYSGIGVGHNNAGLQRTADADPIPQGAYTSVNAYDTRMHGPNAIRLARTPLAATVPDPWRQCAPQWVGEVHCPDSRTRDRISQSFDRQAAAGGGLRHMELRRDCVSNSARR